MRTYITTLFLASAALLAVSCDKKAATTGGAEESIPAVQEPAVDTLAQHRADSLRADSIRRAEADAFVTYDLAFFDLHGHVKSFRQNGDTYNFTREGKLIGHVNHGDDYDPFAYERDEKGRICGTGNAHLYFEWGPGMRLKRENFGHSGCVVETTYIYNEQGQRVGERVKGIDMDWDEVREEEIEKEYSYSVTYSNVVRDEHGNVISYKIKNKEGKAEPVKRTITYYE